MKNLWVAGETFSRSKLNEPFFIQSGAIIAGGPQNGALALQVSPGRMRFPYNQQPLVVANSQSFVIPSPSLNANTCWSVFISDQGQLLASAHVGLVQMPDAPRVNCEYVGTVAIGATVTTPNLTGPWNMAVSGLHDTRGAAVAITPARQRVMESQRLNEGTQTAVSIGFQNPHSFGAATLGNNQSGNPISIGPPVTVGQPANSWTMVHAMVQWMPSGSTEYFANSVITGAYYLTSGFLRVGPVFYVQVGGVSDPQGAYLDTHSYFAPQSPDNIGAPTNDPANNVGVNIHTSSWSFLCCSGANDDQAFQLMGYLHPNHTSNGPDNVNPGFRVVNYSLVVEPGKARSRT